MPPMNRGAFSNSIAPGFRKVVFETYRERPTIGDKLVNMGSSRLAYERDFPVAGFGTMPVKGEGGPVAYQDAVEGLEKRYMWTTYALGFKVTEEMMEDDLYQIFGSKMSKALGRSARNNFEFVSHAPFNSAFDTAVVGFAAGESLCGSHTSLKGVVQTNVPSTASDITLPALQAAVEAYVNLQDEAGLPMVIIPKWLVHNPGDRWIVTQLLRSQYLPGGNQNDVNQLANEGIQPIETVYLTDTDSWFLLGDQRDVNYFDRRAPKFSNVDDFETGDAKFKLSRRNGAGFGDWRGVYGSQGS